MTFLRYLLQLILSPANGWDDLGIRRPDPSQLLDKGLYPLLGLSALTEFLALVYDPAAGLMQVLVSAVTDFGAYLLAIYVARLVLESMTQRYCAEPVDKERLLTLIVMGTGLMVLFQIVNNCLPWNLVILKFLPLYVVLVLSKSFRYLGIRRRDEMRFLGVASAVIVAVPLGIYYLIYLLIK